MSEYIGHYRSELIRQGHRVATECMYFWVAKHTAFRWVRFLFQLRNGYDAVLVQHTPTASGPLVLFFLLAASWMQKTVAVVGHEPPSIYAKHLPPWFQWVYHLYERLVFDLAAIPIVHTRQHADELKNVGCKKEIQVIPIPVYGPIASTSSPSASITFPAKKELETWCYYGMISPKKGLDLLLNAYQSRKPGTYPKLVVIGGAAPGNETYLSELMQTVRPEFSGHIQFLGYLDAHQLNQAFAHVKLVLFPYRWVSQSAALGQTCFQNIPYLAADLPYFRDFNTQYGCGRLFEPDSESALAKALDEACANPMKAEECPFESLRKNLGLETTTRQLIQAIRTESHAL
jgi:glycosyltransferase involved in cell wall biosynthesis